MPTNPKPFNSLLKVTNAQTQDRWYPTAVNTYKFSFNLDMSIENSEALRSNLAYSMQYLEFLEKEIEELKLSDVIYTMLVKTYVVTGMSVLEGLFVNIVKSNRWWKTSALESLGTTQASETRFGTEKIIVKTELFKKVDEYPLKMNLDELIKILERHHQALQVNHLVYPALKRLKDLRNRVHLQKVEDRLDHDYNAFNFSVKKEMGSILYEILSSPMVTSLPHNFEFLKKNTDEAYTHD